MPLLSSARRLRQNLELEHGIWGPDTIARDLYGEAGYIVDSVVTRFEPKKSIKERIDSVLTSPNFGIVVLISALLLTFLLVFRVGGFLENWIVNDIFEPHVILPVENFQACRLF